MDIAAWRARLKEFANERDWGRFHSPKNLSMALSVEVAELVELFQWKTEAESRAIMRTDQAEAVEEELADIAIYLVQLVEALDIDLESAMERKFVSNGERY